MGRGLRVEVGAKALEDADQFHGSAGADMLDDHVGAGAQGKHTVPGHQRFFSDGRRTVDAELFGNRAVVDPVVFNEGGILFVEADRYIQFFRPVHGFVEECAVAERDAVVREPAGAGFFQRFHIGQFFPFQTAGDAGRLADPDLLRCGPLKDVGQDFRVVHDRRSVGHADDGGEAALCRGKRAGMQRFFIGESGIPEMDVGVDQPGSDGEPFGVDDFLII